MNSANCLHSVVMLICFLYAGCEDITVNLGETRNISVLSGKSVKLTCIHSSSIDTNQPRRWYENTDLIISGGIVANSNSGYSETVGTDRFTLTTPAVNDSFVGYKYTCRYVFDEGYFYLTAVEKQMSTEECTGSFHCGFWPPMLVDVSSIIIFILMWLEVERFGGFSTVKIVIIVIFSVVAIGIGLGLGLGLQKGQENCLNCGATIGISISLGVALSVIQFIVIIKYNKEKGCDGKSKGFSLDNCFRKCSVKPDVDKKTPASATGINLETKKKSQNKPTEKGTEASSLTSKSFGHPLPETPNSRKNQLEPLKTDSFEVENPSTEKKKKKKRKKKKETSEGNEASEEKEERPELEF